MDKEIQSKYVVQKQNDARYEMRGGYTQAVGWPHWGVYRDGKLVEGGFFTEAAAEFCAESKNAKQT